MAYEIGQGPDGLYSLCMFEADKYTDEEIKEIFSRHGEVIKMNRSNSLAFVRFKTLLEATTCLEAMKREGRFKVNPGRSNKSSVQNSERNRDSKSGINMNRGRWANDSDGRNGASGGDSGFRQRGGNNVGPPKLIPFPSSLPPEVDDKNLPESKMLFIANFKPTFKQHNIYELCSKSGVLALHVAMKQIKRSPYPPIHYALVYVKDEKGRKNLIDSLNNLQVNGYQLVVSSYETLVEEGKALQQCTSK